MADPSVADPTVADPTVRQQVLQLWLVAAALDTPTVGWAFFDGTAGRGPALPDAQPPYRDGVEALEDGWMLLQAPGPIEAERVLAETGSEFVFTRVVTGTV